MMTVIDVANRFFNRRWVVIPAQPILYFFLFLAAVWIAVGHYIFGVDTYIAYQDMQSPTFQIWCLLGITDPLLCLLATHLVFSRNEIWLYRGLYWRAAADGGMLCFVVMYNVFSLPRYFPDHPVHVCLELFATVFVVAECVRDVWTLVSMELVGQGLRRGD